MFVITSQGIHARDIWQRARVAAVRATQQNVTFGILFFQ